MKKRKFKDLTGRKFNHWEVLNFSFTDKRYNAYFACMCDLCERVFDVRSDSLQSGRSKKCKYCAARERMHYARAI